jgi:hypothetical protein
MVAGRPLGEVVGGRIFYGVKTGLNKAFIVDQATRDRLVADDPSCVGLLFQMRRGEDLRPWYQEDEGKWLIALPNKWTAANFGSGLDEPRAWQALQSRHSSLAAHLSLFAEAARSRQDKGEYWWELRPCDYYDAFDTPKIFWPDIAKTPRFVWDDSMTRIGNTAYFASPATPYLLGILASRVIWYSISQLSQSFGERAGVQRYRLFTQTMSRLPIPDAPSTSHDAIAALALAITEHARARYSLHRQTRHRILTDLGAPTAKLNQKLTAWWELDFAGFLAQVRMALKRDIPLRQRDDWEGWLAEQSAEHRELTAEVVRLETELNKRVYALFDLTPDEIKIIEDTTRFEYGEV